MIPRSQDNSTQQCMLTPRQVTSLIIVGAGEDSAGIGAENPTGRKTFKQHKDKLFKWFKTDRPGLRVLPGLALLLMGVIFIIAGPVYRVFALSMSSKNKERYMDLFLTENGVASPACPVSSKSKNSTYVEVALSIIQLTAAQASVRLVGDFHAYGGFAADKGASLLKVGSNQRLHIAVEKSKASFRYGEVLGKMEVTEFMDYANPFSSYTFYPMDKYIVLSSVTAYIKTTVNGIATTSPVALCVRYKNRLTSFQSKTIIKYAGFRDHLEDGQVSMALADITFSRTPAAQFFSLFICILMWCLSTFQLVMAIDHLFLRPREPPPSTVGTSIGLLFALPTVRNTQPEVPPIGVVVDLLGFFWNISSVAAAAVMLMAAFVGYNRHKPMAE